MVYKKLAIASLAIGLGSPVSATAMDDGFYVTEVESAFPKPGSEVFEIFYMTRKGDTWSELRQNYLVPEVNWEYLRDWNVGFTSGVREGSDFLPESSLIGLPANVLKPEYRKLVPEEGQIVPSGETTF